MRILAILAAVCLCACSALAQEQPEVFPQQGHYQGVFALAFSPDGNVLASGAADNTVKLWDVPSRREIRTLGPNFRAVSLAFSPDGRILAAGTLDQTIRLVDPASGRELRVLNGNSGGVWSIAISPDGRILASGDDLTVRLWDLETGQPLATLGGFSKSILSVAFSPNGQLVAANSEDHKIRLWDVTSGRELRGMTGYAIGRAAFSPDGRMIAAGSSGHTIKFWDIASGRELRTLRGHSDYISFLGFSPDGRILASSSYDRTVKLWDVANGREVGTLTGTLQIPSLLWATSMAFSPTGHMLALGIGDGGIRLWDTATGQELPALGGHSVGVTSALFSPDGKLVAFGSFDGTIRIWDAASGREVRVLRGHSGFVMSIAFSNDGRVLASGSTDRTAMLWDVATGRQLRTMRGHSEHVTSVAFSPDGRMLATGSGDRTIKFWDTASGAQLRTLTGHTSLVNSVAFSPDGRTLASGGGQPNADGVKADNAVKLWDVATGAELRTILGHSKWITSVSFAPDGKLLASASDDRTVKLWDTASGREARTFGGFFDRVSSVAFSPDGRTLAAGAHDGLVKLWEVATGNEIRTLQGRTDLVASVAFSADGQRLVTASWSSTVRIWNVASGKEKVSFVAFTDGSSLAITPEGYYDASSEKAEENLNVRVGSRVFAIASYRDKFYRPDLLKLSLAGTSLKELGFANIGSIKVAPIVEFVDLPPSISQPKLTVTLRITDSGGGLGQVRLFLNGTAVVQDNTPASPASLRSGPVTRAYSVQLADGPNVLQAEAYNAENSMHSTSPTASIAASFPPATRANLHAVVVGIQEFRNSNYNLTYPIKDAQLFAETLSKYSAPLFEKIDVQLLITPAQTTREALLQALKDMQAIAGPDDLFVFYVASHGIADDGEYFLITSNVGSASTEHLRSDAVSKEELTALVANIPATKKLMVIDTCHADALGTALQTGLLTRGLDEVTALKILSRAVGTTVLAASTSTQQALEGYQGHGLFTFVVAEGLSGKGDVDQSGYVSTLGLAHYIDNQVPDLAQRQFNHPQFPTTAISGQEFPLTKVR